MANPLDLEHESYFAPIMSAITNMFPVRGNKRDLVVDRFYFTDQKNDGDYAAQKKSIMHGQTWGPKLMADVRVVDKSGKTVAAKKGHYLGRIPQMTPRYSFDVAGTPYKVSNQTRLKSGAYPRVRPNGELETQFNLVRGENFRVEIDPKSGRASMTFLKDKSRIPLVPILNALGVSDAKMRQVLGDRIVDASRTSNVDKALSRFHMSAFGRAPEPSADLSMRVREFFDGTEIRPDTTEYVYGKQFNRVDGDLLTRSLDRMLGIYRGTAEPVNRDSEVFKEILPPGELVADRIQRSYRSRTRRIQNQLDLAHGSDSNETIGRVLPSDTFDMPIRAFFTSTASAGLAAQLNPVNMITGALSVSPMGEGGISNPDMIMNDLKLVDASRTGIHDPIQTPEGSRTGVTTFLARGARIDGRQAKTQVWDVKAKKLVERTPMELSKAVVAFGDQYTTAMKPKSTEVSAFGSVGEEAKVKASQVDYVMPSPDSHFSWATNMIPFLPNNQGNRSNMVYRHFEQTIGLKNREAPRVQVRFEMSDRSYEDVVGDRFSQKSPVDGTVMQVTPDKMVVKGKDGKRYTVDLYNNFPLGDNKAFMTSLPQVEKGQEVKAGDLLADSNFTRGGTLALGANFRTAVIPYKGWNFEDGYVVSESAAQKLTSEHMHSKDVEMRGEDFNRDITTFSQYVPTPKEQLDKLDESGVIKPGQTVEKGDILVAGLKKREWDGEMVDLGKLRGAFKRGLDWKDASMRWDSNFKGVVVDQVTKGGKTTVYVRTDEPAQVGDKITNRHAAKGVIVKILPDNEMPRTKDGKPAEILLNPTTVGGRINSSQINELVLGRVSEATGETYTVKNFDQNDEYIEVKSHLQTYHTSEGPKQIRKKSYKRKYPERIMEEMEKAGVKDREEMIDPETGKSLGKIMVGPLYFMKLMHQAEKKASARGLGPTYDITGIPKSGGKHGAQAIGELGIYAMLAHGNTAMLRGAQTYKGDATQQDFFTALQQDEPLPPVQVPNAFERFKTFLEAAGLNIQRDGDRLYLLPSKDEEILSRSNGEVDPTKVVKTYTNDPEKGGIFDEELTGGKNGKYWTHFPLDREMINPVFEGAVKSILGLTDKDFQALSGVAKRGGKATAPTLGVDKEGNIVPAEQATKVGQDAIIDLLRRVNVDTELERAKEELQSARESELNKAYKRFRALNALSEHGNTTEAFIVKNVAVAPPIFRPITKMASGTVTFDDMNQLYRDIGLINEQLRELPPEYGKADKLAIEANLYDALGALSGLGGEAVYSHIANSPRGNLKRIAGDRPKEGFFQKQLIKRRNDMTMRATIIPDTTLSMDQVGIPEKQAYQLYKPLIVRDLVRHGFSPLESEKHIKGTTDIAKNALDRVAQENPVLLKRDPVLHKFGILGFNARIVPGESIRLHPLVTTGFNADFDGDTMSAYVAVTPEEIEEAKRIFPSRILFSPVTGDPAFVPTLETQIGVYLYSLWGKDSGKKFSKESDVLDQLGEEQLKPTDVIQLNGKKTTAGRVALNRLLDLSDKDMSDPKFALDTKNTRAYLTHIGKAKPAEYGNRVDQLKNIGNEHVYHSGWTYSLKDFMGSPLRDKIVEKYQAKIDLIPKRLSDEQRQERIAKINEDLEKELKQKLLPEYLRSGNTPAIMLAAGTKPSWAQLKQLNMTPGALPAKGRYGDIPKHSYGEGVSLGTYYRAAHSARQGVIDKVFGVRGPGYLSKQLANTVIDLVVHEDDCGAKKGQAISIDNPELPGRFLVKPITVKGKSISAGTMVTPELQAAAQANGLKSLDVRSPLGHIGNGMCKKCYGHYPDGTSPDIGDNIGIVASQAFGERSAQLKMRTFHTGGVGSSELAQGFDRVQQLFLMPKELPGKASLSPARGIVSNIRLDRDTGASYVTVDEVSQEGKPTGTSQEVYVPPKRPISVDVGATVLPGTALSSGPKDPRELLKVTGDMDQVRNYLTEELYKQFKNHGITRLQSEVVVKGLTDLGVVENQGEHPGFVRGDKVSLSEVEKWNSGRPMAARVKVKPVLVGAGTLPLEKTQDFLARMNYQRIMPTIVSAANQGWHSDLHGFNPIPGLAYGAEFGLGEGGRY